MHQRRSTGLNKFHIHIPVPLLFTEITSSTVTVPVDTTSIAVEISTAKDEQISSTTAINTVESSSGTAGDSDSLGNTESPVAVVAEESPLLPTSIPNSINFTNAVTEKPELNSSGGSISDGGVGNNAKEEEDHSITDLSIKEKESRSLDDTNLTPGKPQGRAFSNFVTVAPSQPGSGGRPDLGFDLSDVSLDGSEDHDKEAVSSKTPTEVTCSHEGQTFKVRSQTDRQTDSLWWEYGKFIGTYDTSNS